MGVTRGCCCSTSIVHGLKATRFFFPAAFATWIGAARSFTGFYLLKGAAHAFVKLLLLFIGNTSA